MNQLTLSSCISFNRSLFMICILGSLAVLSSVITELYLNMKPCFLCKMQRWGFFVLACISLTGIFSKKKKHFLLASFILGLAILCIAIYHFAVQSGWVSDPCSVSIPYDLISFKTMIAEKNVPCSKVFSIFSIPFPICSMVFSVLCTTLASYRLQITYKTTILKQ